MKIWNKNICLTDRLPLLVIAIVLFSTFVLANVWTEPIVEAEAEDELWVPTIEDIAYQDSMFNIIQSTQSDVDTIKVQVKQIIKRLDNFDE